MAGWRWGYVAAALFFAACGGATDDSEVEVGELTSSEQGAERSLEAARNIPWLKNALSTRESQTVLKLIDDICGDTWCSGDYDFAFRRISCDKRSATCLLTLQIFPRDGVVSSQASYFRTCKTHGFTGFESLVTTSANGYRALNERYYDALTECTSRITAKLR